MSADFISHNHLERNSFELRLIYIWKETKHLLGIFDENGERFNNHKIYYSTN